MEDNLIRDESPLPATSLGTASSSWGWGHPAGSQHRDLLGEQSQWSLFTL